MPVTLITTEHSASEWGFPKASSAEDLFSETCPKHRRNCKQTIQHSFLGDHFDTAHVSSSGHVRPEDVWFSILAQVNFFINAHAEELRSFFVSHGGQKELEVISDKPMMLTDFGAMALLMTQEIEKNVIDPDLRGWIMPDFTTTSKSDIFVAAVLMMGTLQQYFTYTFGFLCGIPSVTLLGEREDWVALVNKLEKLQKLGNEPARFAQLLRPILNHFVASFDNPESCEVIEFWGKCAKKTILGQWVTRFARVGVDILFLG